MNELERRTELTVSGRVRLRRWSDLVRAGLLRGVPHGPKRGALQTPARWHGAGGGSQAISLYLDRHRRKELTR